MFPCLTTIAMLLFKSFEVSPITAVVVVAAAAAPFSQWCYFSFLLFTFPTHRCSPVDHFVVFPMLEDWPFKRVRGIVMGGMICEYEKTKGNTWELDDGNKGELVVKSWQPLWEIVQKFVSLMIERESI